MDYSLADFESELLNWGDDDDTSSITNNRMIARDNENIRECNDNNSIINLQRNDNNESDNKIITENNNVANVSLRPKRNSSISNTVSLSTTTPTSSQVISSSSKSSKNNSVTSDSRNNTSSSNNTSINNNYNSTSNNIINNNSDGNSNTRASVNFTSHPSMIQQMAAVSQFPSNWATNFISTGNNNNVVNSTNIQMINQFQLNPELIYSSTVVPPNASTDNGAMIDGNNYGNIGKSGSPSLVTPLQYGAASTTSLMQQPSSNINNLTQSQHQQNGNNLPMNNSQVFLPNYSQVLPRQQNVVCLDSNTNASNNGIPVMALPYDGNNSKLSPTQPINFNACSPVLNNQGKSNSQQPVSSQTSTQQQQPYNNPWNLMQQQQQYFQKASNTTTTAATNQTSLMPFYQPNQEETNNTKNSIIPNNQQHYGMTVNGFHPQVNAQDNPHLTPIDTYNIINNRDNDDNKKNNKSLSCKERNEREQKRAQKISDLIESLRLSMENSGWKVEVKSKYHTLSKCTEYVRHLIQVTTEKEEALERAKAMSNNNGNHQGGAVKTENIEESVTSSLTSCSLDNHQHNHNKKKRRLSSKVNSSSYESTTNALSKSLSALNKAAHYTTTTADEKNPSLVPSSKLVNDNDSEEIKTNNGSVASPTSTSSRNAQHPHAVSSITYNKMLSSSISEMTDSNTSSTAKRSVTINNNEKVSSSPKRKEVEKDDENKKHKKKKIIFVDSEGLKLNDYNNNDNDANNASTTANKKHERRSSTSTTAAVASIISDQAPSKEGSNNTTEHSSKNKKRKRKHTSNSEKLWVNEKSDVDYEEVFQTSNVPQIIATIAGRIIRWNRVFLKATGLTSKQTNRLTLFSLVQGDKLSNLFEVVGNALKIANQQKHLKQSNSNDENNTTNDTTKASSKQNSKIVSSSSPSRIFKRKKETTTLPCILFPSNCSGENSHPNAFFMTVTVIHDDTMNLKDAISSKNQKFLHCVLTDSPPGCNGIGGVTSALLARMYSW